MTRLEIIEKLADLEERQAHFKALDSDVSDYYTKETLINAHLETTMFDNKRKYDVTKYIRVDKELFKEYVRKEIELLEAEINALITALSLSKTGEKNDNTVFDWEKF